MREVFRFVLTAAHCITYKGEKVFVVVGDHDKEDAGEDVTKRIKGIGIPHKNYDPNTLENDVAVVRYEVFLPSSASSSTLFSN